MRRRWATSDPWGQTLARKEGCKHSGSQDRYSESNTIYRGETPSLSNRLSKHLDGADHAGELVWKSDASVEVTHH